jgi:hypothetical protein
MISVTKFIFPVLMLLFVSCTKHERKPRQRTDFTGFSVDVGINDKSSTGQIIENPAPVSIIHVWKANNKQFEIIKVSDAVDGYATEMTSGRLESASYHLRGSSVSQRTTEGKYFVFLMLDESPSIGKFAYSYTTFEVIKGEKTTLKKTFTSRVGNTLFEDWNASE